MFDSFSFLSRLCGVEPIRMGADRDRQFLSRLCGVELRKIGIVVILCFLSRLCGVERLGVVLRQP